MEIPFVKVVAGILKQQNCYLLCQRPQGKIYENFWEFPGGKIEINETPLNAIFRELKEELNIEIDKNKTFFWFNKKFIYPHSKIHLHFFRIEKWDGEINVATAEHQALSWQKIPSIFSNFTPSVSPLLPANFPIMQSLALPEIALICENSADKILKFLQQHQQHNQQQNLQRFLIIFREKSEKIFRKKFQNLVDFYQQLNSLNLKNQQIILATNISQEMDWQIFNKLTEINTNPQICSNALHFSADYFAKQQNAIFALKQQHKILWLGVSTHNAKELAEINKINEYHKQNVIDYAFLSPIFTTKTHPEISENQILGLEKFKNIVANLATIPVFGLGGLSLQKDLENIKNANGQGIATISGI